MALRLGFKRAPNLVDFYQDSLVWRNVSVQRGKVIVIKNLSLNIPLGSTWAITGSNGSGKTTLLESIVFPGMHRVSGTFSYGPFKPYDISYLAQKSLIQRSFPLSIYQLVSKGLWRELGSFKALTKDHHTRIWEALHQVGLENLAYQSIGQLSGGQFQRVRFARMILQNCPLVLLDEPFSGLDHATTQHLRCVLATMVSKGKTVMLVLHDPDMIQAYGDHVVSLASKEELDTTDYMLPLSNFQRVYGA